ncbi:MAG: TonB-dependent receptor [Candidatus Hatepunaea meridiana]|nr:TonB-dependent receptor [Candidatus Hatepunaea meridiana]
MTNFASLSRLRSKSAGFFIIQATILILFWIFLLITPAQAAFSYQISGSVTDTSGLPLPGAHITVIEKQTGATTKWNGQYRIHNLTPGDYTLTASYLGYQTSIRQNIIVCEGVVRHIDFVLHRKQIIRPIAEVRTSQQSIEFNNDRSLMIKPEFWLSKGVSKIGDALRDVPGVMVLEGDGSQRLSLRGSPSRTVRVDIDGIPLNDAGTGEAEIGNIDLDQLNAIHIEFEGLGGRVHLQTSEYQAYTETPNDLSALITNGSYGRNKLGIRFIKRSECALQRVSTNPCIPKTSRAETHTLNSCFQGNLQFTHEVNDGDFKYLMDDGFARYRVNNYSRSTSGIGSLGYTAGKLYVEGGLHYDDSKRGIPGLICEPATPEADLTTKRISARISGQGDYGNNQLKFTSFVSDYSSRFTSPIRQFNPETGVVSNHFPEDDRQIGLRYGITTNSIRNFSSGKLRVGYAFQHDRYKGKDLVRGRISIGGIGRGDAKRTLNRFELGGQWWTKVFGLSFHLNPGLASDLIDDEGNKSYSTISPSCNIALDKSNKLFILSITSGWGQSMSAPPFNALFLIENAFAVGNKNLKPERGKCFNAGVGLASVNSSSIPYRFRMTWIQQRTTDLIIWRRNFQGKYYPANVDRVKSRSVEFYSSIFLFRGGISLSGSYIYNNLVNDTPGNINYGKMTPLIAKHSGSASISIKCWETALHLNGRWVGRRYSTESNLDPMSTAGMGLSPYEVYDAYLSRNFKFRFLSLSCGFGVDNMLDKSYRVIERSPMPGRTYAGRLSLSI